MSRAMAIGALLTGALLSASCAFGGGQSGWELIPERAWSMQMPSFPDMPMSFPEPPRVGPGATVRSPVRGTFTHALDEDSLFRRGYSAPTP